MRIADINTAASLRACCDDQGACEDALDWLDTLPEDTPLRDVYGACPRGEWLLWALPRAGIDIAPIMPAVYAAVDRAVRQYAPTALRTAGLDDWAARLEALPEIVDRDSADAAGRAASAAADAVRADTNAADRAAAWAAAWAAAAARAAADRAADAEAWATDAAANAAAWAASKAEAAEHRRCADEIRALIPWEQIEKEINYEHIR